MLIFEMSNIYSLEMFVLRRRKDISLCPLPYLYEKKWSQWQMKDIEKIQIPTKKYILQRKVESSTLTYSPEHKRQNCGVWMIC